MGLGDVNHDDALVHIDLGRGEPDPRGGVHGLGHVVDEFADPVVDQLHRLRDGVQACIGIVQYIESGHKNFTNEWDAGKL
jgi:hypothetical protein